MQNTSNAVIKFSLLLFLSLFPVLCTSQVVRSYQQVSDGINVILPEGTLNIYPLTDYAIRIRFYKDPIVKVPELIFTAGSPVPGFQVSDLPSELEIKVKNMIASLDKQSGTISFTDHSGNVFLCEKEGARKLMPDSVMGEPCFMAEQSFESPAGEYIFGLGQFQDGHYNLRGISRRLIQVNSQIAVPFIYSSRGYGLLWHQYGLTDYNPADSFITLEKKEQSGTAINQMAEVTTTTGTQKVYQDQSIYLGRFNVLKDGE